jgi:hypothetical protein
MKKLLKLLVLLVAVAAMALFAYYFKNGLLIKSAENYGKAFTATSEHIELIISKENFKKIEEHRNDAISKGKLMNIGDNYVDGKLVYKGDTLKIELRLKGHMLDHVKGDKWSYRIKVKKGKTFMGMKRFSIQHPGTRNYAYEWLYHKMMASKNIIALNYDFITVTLNGKNLGVYAVEEHFAQELALRNKRPNGPFMRFNPELYWVRRFLVDNEKISVNEEYSPFSSSFLEPFELNNTLEDSTLKANYLAAQLKMEQFKLGQLTTSEVFDVDKLAHFHAVIDIMGGHHSLDWSDVKYYYNPESERIEPVAYESVSAFDIKKLCGSYNYVSPDKKDKTFHQQLFSDATFFRAYIKVVESITSKKWLEEFLAGIDSELQEKLRVIYSEFPYKDFTTDVYFKNQKKIAAILDEPRPYQAFLQGFDTTKMEITLSLGGVSQLPYEIKSISCGSEKIMFTNLITPSKSLSEPIDYNNYSFTVGSVFMEKLQKGKSLEMEVSILGAQKIKTVEVFPYPYQYSLDKRSEKVSGIHYFVFNQDSTTAYLPSGNYEFSDTIVFPNGVNLKIERATNITLLNNSQIIINGDVEFIGGRDDDDLISFFGMGEHNFLHVQSFKKGNSKLKFVLFNNVSINFIDAQIDAQNIGFINGSKAISVDRSNLNLDNSSFEKVNTSLVLYNSRFKITNINVSNCNVFIEASNAKGEVFNSEQTRAKRFLNELSTSEIVKVERKKGDKYVK